MLNKSAIFVNKKKLCMLSPRCGSDKSDDLFLAVQPRLSTVLSKFSHIFLNFIRVSLPGGCHPGRSDSEATVVFAAEKNPAEEFRCSA